MKALLSKAFIIILGLVITVSQCKALYLKFFM